MNYEGSLEPVTRKLEAVAITQRREIRRLRRALREVVANTTAHFRGYYDADGDYRDRDVEMPDCLCARCIATRALKGPK